MQYLTNNSDFSKITQDAHSSYSNDSNTKLGDSQNQNNVDLLSLNIEKQISQEEEKEKHENIITSEKEIKKGFFK